MIMKKERHIKCHFGEQKHTLEKKQSTKEKVQMREHKRKSTKEKAQKKKYKRDSYRCHVVDSAKGSGRTNS